jgi:hypothetical protein
MYVYILQTVIEKDDGVNMEIDSVYTTSEKAHAVGKNLIAMSEKCPKDKVLHYNVTGYRLFQ